jgi:hypothetical protein
MPLILEQFQLVLVDRRSCLRVLASTIIPVVVTYFRRRTSLRFPQTVFSPPFTLATDHCLRPKSRFGIERVLSSADKLAHK